MKDRKQCLHESGFYVKYVGTYTQWYDETGYADYASGVTSRRGGKVGYCADCGKRLGRVKHGRLVSEPDARIEQAADNDTHC